MDSGESGLTPTLGGVSSPFWRRQGWVEGCVNKCCEKVGAAGPGDKGTTTFVFFSFSFSFFFL